ncbi:MAG TPA: protease modulator HflC [Candidatus Sulfotelmatobacter sp.]|nr:protease modulator HflC [Candidatus Sulfotelmatobacter sp.]
MSRAPLPLLVLIAIIVAIFVAYESTFIVLQSEQALVLQFGDPKRVVDVPGLGFKLPFVQNVAYMDKRILALDTPPEQVNSADRKLFVVDAFARWRIVDPLKYYQTAGSEAVARARLGSLLNSNLRNVLATQDFQSILSTQRVNVMVQIRGIVNDEATRFGIQVVDVRIKRTDLPEGISEAIYQRMRAERDKEAKQNRAEGAEIATKIRADADRQRTVLLAEAQKTADIVRGEGDAERTRIFAEAAAQDPEFYAFYRSLQAYRDALGGQDTTLVTSPNSDFFRYFNSLPDSLEKPKTK